MFAPELQDVVLLNDNANLQSFNFDTN